VVDSSSTDGTPELADKAGAKVLVIPQQEFNHGESRNLGISYTSGELVVLMTQDAVPENDNWLFPLVGSVIGDDAVSGAYSRNAPHPNTPPWILHQMEDHGVLSDEPRVQNLGESESLDSLPPMEQLRLCTFDNVSSLIRKSAWVDNPFPRVPFAEDLAWAKAEIMRGHKIVYQPESGVIHSHRRGPMHEYRRSKVAHQRLVELFNLRLVQTIPLLVRYSLQNMLRLTGWALKTHPVRLGDIVLAPFVAMAETMGQYVGARSAVYLGERQP
jgi:rhamnosyltransferase